MNFLQLQDGASGNAEKTQDADDEGNGEREGNELPKENGKEADNLTSTTEEHA